MHGDFVDMSMYLVSHHFIFSLFRYHFRVVYAHWLFSIVMRTVCSVENKPKRYIIRAKPAGPECQRDVGLDPARFAHLRLWRSQNGKRCARSLQIDYERPGQHICGRCQGLRDKSRQGGSLRAGTMGIGDILLVVCSLLRKLQFDSVHRIYIHEQVAVL